MNEIDYTKWSGSMFCRRCVKELLEEDCSTKEIKVYGTKHKVPFCNECGAEPVGFSSKLCFETNPVSAYFRCFLITLFISGFFCGMGYILGPKEGVDPSTAQTATVLISLGASTAMIWIVNRQNNISKEIIKKIESKKNRQTI